MERSDKHKKIFSKSDEVPSGEDLFHYLNPDKSKSVPSAKSTSAAPKKKQRSKSKEENEEEIVSSENKIFILETPNSKGINFEKELESEERKNWLLESKINSNILYQEGLEGLESKQNISLFDFEDINSKINKTAQSKSDQNNRIRVAATLVVTLMVGSIGYYVFQSMQSVSNSEMSYKNKTEETEKNETPAPIEISIVPSGDSSTTVFKDKTETKSDVLEVRRRTREERVPKIVRGDSVIVNSEPIATGTVDDRSAIAYTEALSEQNKGIGMQEKEEQQDKDVIKKSSEIQEQLAIVQEQKADVLPSKQKQKIENRSSKKRSVPSQYSGDEVSNDIQPNFKTLYDQGKFEEAYNQLLNQYNGSEEHKLWMAKIEFARKNYEKSITYSSNFPRTSKLYYESVWYLYLNYGALNNSEESLKYRKILSEPDSPYREKFAPR